MTKLKAKGKLQKVFHDAQTLALVGFYINLRRQAIAYFFLKINPKFFARKNTIPFIQSYHISQLHR